MIDLVKKMRAKAMFHLKNKGGKVMDVSLPEIPDTWSFFPNTEDLWCKVEYPDDADITGCLYKGLKGSIFWGHKHNYSIEQMMILNEDGKIRVFTEDYNQIMTYSDVVVFKKGEAHLVEFLEDTLIQVVWHPKMNGWNAEFIGE